LSKKLKDARSQLGSKLDVLQDALCVAPSDTEMP
jgi:hypothetical protein